MRFSFGLFPPRDPYGRDPPFRAPLTSAVLGDVALRDRGAR
ncbi:MAG: hypothetical protein AVDCRST_MAG79-1500 [uncultured Thermoleophilia bacterium]|uniref:Uncharacterized protein n=1 Tax=uncultured Thermoleophilia bacterium TaxID=1497501 RepID=A0A6J4U2Z5_9ACTN|nr:MAG: hypothetical protein AVDCRST_MAG79-1500 [uncultured Thermoleophilia bacterium]